VKDLKPCLKDYAIDLPKDFKAVLLMLGVFNIIEDLVDSGDAISIALDLLEIFCYLSKSLF
jgi:hypothetical protein